MGKCPQGYDPFAANAAKGRTIDHVATAVGLGSGDTYERTKKLLLGLRDSDPDLISALSGRR